MQAERDQLRAEKANFQRIAQANAEQAKVHRQMKEAGLVGQNPEGVWAIKGGDSLANPEAGTKAKAQLLNVSKGKSP